MRLLLIVALVGLAGCATAAPLSPPTPMGECGNICRGGDVDYYKSRDLECQCQDRLELD